MSDASSTTNDRAAGMSQSSIVQETRKAMAEFFGTTLRSLQADMEKILQSQQASPSPAAITKAMTERMIAAINARIDSVAAPGPAQPAAPTATQSDPAATAGKP